MKERGHEGGDVGEEPVVLLNGNDWVDRWRELSGHGTAENAVFDDGT